MAMYIDKEKNLIKNTTKEERAVIVKNAIGLGSIASQPPTKSAMVLIQKYIDGEMEIKEVQRELIENYSNYLD